MRDEIERFNDLAVQPFGVNPASVRRHQHYAEKLGFPFPLLSDPTRSVADAYGALRFGTRLIHRTVVVVTRDGRVRFSARGRPPIDDLLAALAEPGAGT